MASSRGNETISIFNDSHGEIQICVKNDRNVGSLGVFYGNTPFDFVLPTTMFQLAVVYITSRMVQFLLKPLRTPKFICNILGGILLGPSFLGRNKTFMDAFFSPRQAEILIVLSLIGVAYFLFIVSLKMDVLMTIKAAKSTWCLGLIPFLTSFILFIPLIYLFYNPQNMSVSKQYLACLSISAALAFNNFPVVSDALVELNLIATELGQIALSASMINDIIVWVFIGVHRLVNSNNVKSSIGRFSSWVLLMTFNFFVLRPAMKLIVRKTPTGKPVKEIFIVFILLGVLIMAGVSDMVGGSFLVGPLMYGLIVPSGPPLGATLVDKSEVIIVEFLLPFFFVYLGLNTNLTGLHCWQKFVTLQCIVFAAGLAKLGVCVLVAQTYNIKAKHGVVLGLILNIKGITELITFNRLKNLKLLDEEMFSILVLCIVVMTAIVTPLVSLLYKHRPRILSSSSILSEGKRRMIQNTPRNSEFHIVACVHNEENVRGITSLLEACNPEQERPLSVYVIHLIELIGKSAPILLPVKYKENRKFLSVNYPNTNHIMRAFENYSKNSSGPVTILSYLNVAPYKSMHVAVCNLAQDKMVPLVIIPFHENDHIDFNGHVSINIRKLNTTFQEHVPCTLGILVDKYSKLGLSNNKNSKLYFHVGIFFIGGPDDREALALGIRMSERVNMKVSLFQFVFLTKVVSGRKFQLSKEDLEEEKTESMLDDCLIDEFKSMKFGTGNVSWYEIMVEDAVQVLDGIRGLEGDYNLVIVGRRHNNGCLNDEEMSNFIENAKILGMFGDMLSSTEFCIGMVPVLVTQCGGDRINKLERVGSANSVSQKSILF